MPQVRIDVLVLPKPYVVEALLEGIHDHGQAHGWRLVVRYTYEPDLALKVRQSSAAGFIVMDGSAQVVRALRKIDRPKLGALLPYPIADMPLLSHDDRLVGRLAARYLLGEGFRRFAFLGVDFPYASRRWLGFTETLEQAGHPCFDNRVETVRGRPRFPVYEDALDPAGQERWLKQLKPPLAVFAASDTFGGQLLDVAERCRYRVPIDVAVIGVNNNRLQCVFSPITLTSIDLDLRSAGREAGRLMQRMLGGAPIAGRSVHLVAPAGVIARRSTEWLTGSDAELDQALTLMRTQAHTGLSVNDMLKEVPISRTSLEQRFKQQLGRTPGEELRRLRFQHATRLLRDTDLNMMQVARRSGYSSSAYLSQVLREKTGLTPRAYRLAQRQAGEARPDA